MANYQLAYDKVIGRLRSARRKETNIRLTSALLNVLSVALLSVLGMSLIEMIANGDTVFRTILAGAVVLATAIAAGVFLLPEALRAFGVKYLPSVENIALRVGDKYPDVRDNLCNAIQLVPEIESNKKTSPDLALAAFSKVESQTRDKNFSAIVDNSGLKKAIVFFFASALVALGSIGFFSNSVGAAFNRIANFNQSYIPPAPFTLKIEPLDASIIRGKQAKIVITAEGTPPETVQLHLKEDQQNEFDSFTLRLDSGNVYTYEIQSLKYSLTYYGSAEWLNSKIMTETGKITVVDKPYVRSIAGRLNYPSYTGLASKQFDEQTADISALRGTSVNLNINSNKELKNAGIVIIDNISSIASADTTAVEIDTARISMKVDGTSASGNFRVRKTSTYFVDITDVDGQKNDDPIRYSIIALNDAYPSISMLQPTFDVQLNEQAILPLKVAISDDYGFSSLKLKYRMIHSRYAEPEKEFSEVEIPMAGGDLAAEVPYLWDLNEVNISPEDIYEFYIEVYDNDFVSGPKSAKTSTLKVRLPSLDEVLSQADETQEKVGKDLEKVMKDAQEISKEMEKLNRELLKKNNEKDLDWKEKKKMEDIVKKQAEMQQKLDDIKKNLEQMTQNLQENNTISQETLQKYMELQKLMEEVNSPELKRMQEMMENAMKNLSPKQLQQAMEQMKFDEERFRKSIERSMKILKRIQAEQKADALSKRADELKEKQEALKKETENANPNDKKKQKELSEEQKRIQEDMQKMMEELNDLDNLMKEIGEDMPQEELSQAKQDLNPQETSQQMQQSQQQLQQGQFNKSMQNQQSASQKLQNFSQQMQQIKQQMQQQAMQEAINKMQKAISDMLELSKEQEDLKQSTQNSDYNSTQIPNYAQQQAEMQKALMNVANSMMQLSEKSFAVTPEMAGKIGDAMRKMQEAIRQLSERQTRNASQQQSGAMASMNEAISQMQQQLSMMQNQGSGSCNMPGGSGMGQSGQNGQMSFSEKLQQMAAQQQALNNQLRQLAQNQGQYSMEQQAEFGRLSEKQGNARKSLEELAREQKESGGEKKALGDLNRIAEEMQEVVSDLESGNVTEETMKKQERILSRLLDANRSVHERDFDKKRRAKSGKEYELASPDAIDLRTQEGRRQAMRELLQSIQQGYTKDYEILIRQYFKSLQKQDTDILQ